MKTIFITLTTLALIASVFTRGYGDYKRIEVKDDRKDELLRQAIKAAEDKIKDFTSIFSLREPTFVTAYQKIVIVNGVFYKIIHALPSVSSDDFDLLETIVFISRSSDGKKIEVDKPIVHTANKVYSEGSIFKELQGEVFHVLGIENAIPFVTGVGEFNDIAKETFYITYTKTTLFNPPNGAVVVRDVIVFVKDGDKYVVGKNVIKH
jgi:hypothetical protein